MSEAETREAFPAYDAVAESFGFVPTSLHVLAHQPEILRRFVAMAGAITGPGSVDLGLKQMVAHVASRAGGCLYCQAHTAEQAAKRGVDAAKVEALWEFESDGRFSEAERAALRLARDAALVPNAVTDAHFDDLRPHFDEAQIVEIVSVIAMFGFLNRFNDTLANALEPDPIAFGTAHLAAGGWTPGKHAAD